MKKAFFMLLTFFIVSVAFAGSYTPYLNLYKPSANDHNWSSMINGNFDLLDSAVNSKPTQSALDAKAPIANPTFTGVATAPTVSATNLNLGYSVFDNFNRSNRTLNGDVSTSGHTWALSGPAAATASIASGKFTSPANVYAYLTDGSPVVQISGTFSFSAQATGTSTTYWPLTLIASKAYDLDNLIHLNFGPLGWSLTKRRSGEAAPFPVLINGSCNLRTDGTIYSVSMLISGSTVTIIAPDGVTYSVTDSDLATIAPTYGIWQIIPSATSTSVGYWNSIQMNGSATHKQTDNLAALGNRAAQSDVTWLQGDKATLKQRIVTSVTGTGWYRISTRSILKTYVVDGNVKITATDSSSGQVWDMDVFAKSSSTAPTIATNIGKSSLDVGAASITQARLSTDSGGNLIGLDIYSNKAGSVALSIEFTGFFTPSSLPLSSGAAVLTTGSVTETFNQTPYSQTISTSVTGTGWYTIATRSTLYSYVMAGNVQIDATDASGRAMVWKFDVGTRDDQNEIPNDQIPFLKTNYLFVRTDTPISQARLSTNSSSHLINLDIYVPNGDAVTLTTTLNGYFTPVAQPVIGATVLATKAAILVAPNYHYETFYSTLTTGFTATIPDGLSAYIITPATALATGTLYMPVNPVEGQTQAISTTKDIDSLTLSLASGQTLSNPITTLSAGDSVSYTWSYANSRWYRVAGGKPFSARMHTLSPIYSVAGWTASPLAETTIYSKVIPGNSIGLNGALDIRWLQRHSSGANNKTMKVTLGGTTFYAIAYTTTPGANNWLSIRNQGATNAQVANPSATFAFGTFGAGQVPYQGTLDTTQDQTLLITGTTTTETGIQTTALVGAAGTCTATKATHGLTSGEYIQVLTGGNCPTSGNPNVTTALVAVTNSSTFTYPCSCVGTEAGVQPTFYRYSDISLWDVDIDVK